MPSSSAWSKDLWCSSGWQRIRLLNERWDRNLKDDPVVQGNKRGRITFATGGPNTRTTQVFINFGDNSRLDADGFAAFGEVIEGMENVDSIYNGYGESPDQGRIRSQGNSYLDNSFRISIPSSPLRSLPNRSDLCSGANVHTNDSRRTSTHPFWLLMAPGLAFLTVA